MQRKILQNICCIQLVIHSLNVQFLFQGSVREVYGSLTKEGGECLEWDFSKS